MHACNVAFSETFVLRLKPHWLHSELLKHWLHSPKDALSTFFTAPHTFPELYCETWLLRQGSVPRVCGIVQKVEKAFVVFSNLASVQCSFWFPGGGRGQSGWQKLAGFRRKQKMPLILSSSAYLQIHGNIYSRNKSLKVLISPQNNVCCGLKYLLNAVRPFAQFLPPWGQLSLL